MMEEKKGFNYKVIVGLVICLVVFLILVVTFNKGSSSSGGGNIFNPISEEEVLKLESTLVSSAGGYYGLYLPKEQSVSIDDVNNPYLIAFNIKKYIASMEGMTNTKSNNEVSFNFPDESLNKWVWDMCINDNCSNTSDYTKLYSISKSDFNEYMHKTYNTTNDYDLLLEDEGKTINIIGSNIVVDSGSDSYNLLLVPKSGGLNTLRAKYIKFETDKDTLYIYDKFVYCYEEGNFKGCYKDMVPVNKNAPIVECSKEEDGSSPFEDGCKINNEESFNDLSGVLNTYKHTFKKVDGNYYWTKSEVVEN